MDVAREARNAIRFIIERWPWQLGKTYAINVMDKFMPRGPETIADIGGVAFPFEENYNFFFYATYEQETKTLLNSWLRPGDVFYDAGANVGYLSAIGANAVGRSGAVHAFEPEPDHYARLQYMAELNPSYNIAANHCAVSDTEETVVLWISEQPGWHTLVPEIDGQEKRDDGKEYCDRIEVPSVYLDEYARKAGDDRSGAVRLVKIDVEGAELKVLRGASRVISEHWADALLIEVKPCLSEEILEQMDEANYRPFVYGQNNRWRSYSGPRLGHKENIFFVKDEILQTLNDKDRSRLRLEVCEDS